MKKNAVAKGLVPDCGESATDDILYIVQLLQSHRYREAEAAAAQALAHHPTGDHHALLYSLKGQALANQSAFEEALACFQVGKPCDIGAVESCVMEAVCWLHLDRPEAALECCDRALACHPDYAQGWLFRGVALHRLGRYREAYQCYQQAAPEDSPPRSLLQRIQHWWQGRSSQA